MSPSRWLLLLTLMIFSASPARARNRHPSSGRRLAYGHWLTCWGGDDSRLRTDPPFSKDTPESEVSEYVPRFSGEYTFDVRDTWEEEVTHSGVDCGHCGETCHGNGDDQHCECNSCSWQETETFYRPWSTQHVTWHAEYVQNPDYQQKRKDWIAKGKPPMSRTEADLPKLFDFDPERPLAYFLFPGEAEEIRVSNHRGIFSSDESIEPSVWIANPRYDYTQTGKVQVQSSIGQSAPCDDRDFDIRAKIYTGKRLVTATPNSIQFRTNWVQGAKDSKGDLTDESAAFELTDVSAMRYEQQDVSDHYKDTHVSVSLWQSGRWLWSVDTKVGEDFEIEDNLSVIQWHDGNPDDKLPPPATYHLMSSDLLKSRFMGNPFHLAAGQTYDVCAYILRMNNVYYKSTGWFGRSIWSEPNCGMFTYKPEGGHDLRSGGRKFRDGLSRFFGFGLF